LSNAAPSLEERATPSQWTVIADWAQTPSIQSKSSSLLQLYSNTRACDYRNKSCMCSMVKNIQQVFYPSANNRPNRKQKIFNLQILTMYSNQFPPANIDFPSTVKYAQGLYKALFNSSSWWAQLNNYVKTLSGDSMASQPGQNIQILQTPNLPFTSSPDTIMTDYYVKLWIREQVSSNSVPIVKPYKGFGGFGLGVSEESVNVMAIHTNVLVKSPTSEITCNDICTYHSSVDVSDITGIPNQYILYMIVPTITSSCKACNALAHFKTLYNAMINNRLMVRRGFYNLWDPNNQANIFGDQRANLTNFLLNPDPNFDIAVTASHELAEVVTSYALAGFRDPLKSEIADICAVKKTCVFIPIINS
jgi:hypothetical protein